jgi:hypothetical protein
MPRAGLDHDPPIYNSCVAGMTGKHYHTQLFTGWDGGLTNFFAWAGLEPQSSQSQPSM